MVPAATRPVDNPGQKLDREARARVIADAGAAAGALAAAAAGAGAYPVIAGRHQETTMRKLMWIIVLMFTWPAHAELPPCPKTLNPGQLQTYPAKKCLMPGCLPEQVACDGKPWAQTTKLNCEPFRG
jgi:hypothetical protein